MAEEYIFKYISRRVYFIRGFLAIAIGLSITLLIATILGVHMQLFIFLGINALITVLLFYYSKNWYKGQLLIRFNEKEIYLSSYFPLFNHSQDYIFCWKDIKSISFVDSQYFKILVITDQKQKLVFALDYEDEVTRFEKNLNKRIYKLNQDKLIRIKLRPTIYDTKIGFGIAAILGLLMIIWPLIAYLNNRDIHIGLAFIFYSGAIFFIYKVYLHKRKKSSG